MALQRALLAGFFALALSSLSGCGPGAVEIRATQTCEGGNVGDCRDRCGKSEGMACYKLGWLHERGLEVEHDFEQSMRLYQQACDGNWPQACRALGDLYWRGERVGLNRKKALEYWERACGLGLEVACPTQLERDIAEGKLVAVPRANGSLSVAPTVNYKGGAPSGVPQPSAPSAPEPSAPTVPQPGLPAAPQP